MEFSCVMLLILDDSRLRRESGPTTAYHSDIRAAQAQTKTSSATRRNLWDDQRTVCDSLVEICKARRCYKLAHDAGGNHLRIAITATTETAAGPGRILQYLRAATVPRGRGKKAAHV